MADGFFVEARACTSDAAVEVARIGETALEQLMRLVPWTPTLTITSPPRAHHATQQHLV